MKSIFCSFYGWMERIIINNKKDCASQYQILKRKRLIYECMNWIVLVMITTTTDKSLICYANKETDILTLPRAPNSRFVSSGNLHRIINIWIHRRRRRGPGVSTNNKLRNETWHTASTPTGVPSINKTEQEHNINEKMDKTKNGRN